MTVIAHNVATQPRRAHTRCRSTPLSALAISRLTRRGSRSGQQPVLERLARHGLVLVQPAGAANLYRLNRQHLLAGAVLAGAGARQELLTRLRAMLAGWSVPATHACLFGSVARDDAGPDSDIDVLLVRPQELDPDDPAWQQQVRALEDAVFSWTGNALEVLETTPADLARAADAGEPIVAAWREDSIQLVGDPLTGLLTART